ncbi:MAG TPA: methyltransferase domain-containing protein [Vicinamibacterales bacterium]|jgi:SAM-dependent methyltransferase
MNPAHAEHLVCPRCRCGLALVETDVVDGRVRSGRLECAACAVAYPIRGFIPRFVDDEGNYSGNFGFQWNRHARTQFDSYSGAPISERRFFESTGWPRQMTGELLLEAGSGSGRFTIVAASTQAFVVSFDYSSAVDANYRNNGHLSNVLIVQASIFEMPFRAAYFSRVLCIGVLQHTPDPARAFQCLSAVVRPKGSLAIDAYQRLPWWKQMWLTKYWVLPITRRLPASTLYRFCVWWVNLWWPITGAFVRLTGRRILSWFLLMADYRGVYPLTDDVQKEWAILDSFDMLSPAFDFPQRVEDIRRWFERANLVDVDVRIAPGSTEICGRGVKA